MVAGKIESFANAVLVWPRHDLTFRKQQRGFCMQTGTIIATLLLPTMKTEHFENSKQHTQQLMTAEFLLGAEAVRFLLNARAETRTQSGKAYDGDVGRCMVEDTFVFRHIRLQSFATWL